MRLGTLDLVRVDGRPCLGWCIWSHNHFPFTTVRSTARIFNTGSVLHGSSGRGPEVLNGARLRAQASAILDALGRTDCTVTIPRTVIRRAPHQPASLRPLFSTLRNVMNVVPILPSGALVLGLLSGWAGRSAVGSVVGASVALQRCPAHPQCRRKARSASAPARPGGGRGGIWPGAGRARGKVHTLRPGELGALARCNGRDMRDAARVADWGGLKLLAAI